MADQHHSYDAMLKAYLKIAALLAVGTILTVAVAFIPIPHMDGVGPLIHLAIGLIIATIKVGMVIWVFMHLKFDNKYLRLFIFVPVFFFFVLTFALNVLGP